MTQLLESDVVTALDEVKASCSTQTYELLEAVLTSQARLIERLQRDNITMKENAGSAYFNVISYKPTDTPSEVAHTKGDDEGAERWRPSGAYGLSSTGRDIGYTEQSVTG
jgi:hypothetical protein